MISDLESLRLRVRTSLMDSDGLVWDVENLDEAIRHALSDVQNISTTKLSINGLDEATITILEPEMATLIVRGAVVYALEMRIIDRADKYELNQTGLDMSGWVEKEKHLYWTELEIQRNYFLQRSNSVPYFTVPDPDGS